MEHHPDFWMSAGADAIGDLVTPRACWMSARLRDEVRDDHMLIKIAPSLTGQTYGLGAQDITSLIISSRYRGSTLFPITEWPCHVYVARILDESITKTLVFTKKQVELVAWGMIFRSIEEAKTQGMETPRKPL